MPLKLTENQLEEIASLMDNEKWEDAKKELLKHRQTNDGRVYFLLGVLFNDWHNPNKDEKEAKRFFELSVDSDNPPSNAFIQLSRMERNRIHASRILRNGLKIYPKNEPLYYYLMLYSEPSDRETVCFEAIKNECISERIKITMAQAYFTLAKHSECVKLIAEIRPDNEGDVEVLKCMKGFSVYELGNHAEAASIFEELIESDINHRLEYAPTFGLILALTIENKIKEANKLAEELPLDIDAESLVGPPGEAYFDVEEYRIKALKLLLRKTKHREIKGRLRGIRGIFTYSEAFEVESPSKTSQLAVIRDLEFAHGVFPSVMKYVEHLFWIYSEGNRDCKKAWDYLLKHTLNSDEDLYIDTFIEVLPPQELNNFIKDFTATTEANPYKAERLAQVILPQIIARLHKEKNYALTTNLAQYFSADSLSKSNSLFEIAYAYSQIKDKESAKKYYLLLVRNDDNNSAALNNLGVIYENQGDLLKAVDSYKKAWEIDKTDKLYQDNLKRAEQALKDMDKEDFELRSAIEGYADESPYVQAKVIEFYNRRDSSGFIVCSYRQAPRFLKMSGARETDFLRDLLSKKYFLKVTDHSYDTQSSVYKLNPYLQPEIVHIEASLKEEGELLEMCQSLSISNLSLIGYENKLLTNVSKIASEDLKTMLQRDLRENAIAILLKQNKSALVLSGSIIEAILTDRVLSKGITKSKVNGKPKNVLEMDLNELLELSQNEKIIDASMAHFAHGVRGYRNLIHPGVEQRKKTIQVSDSNAKLAWDIVKKLITEVK